MAKYLVLLIVFEYIYSIFIEWVIYVKAIIYFYTVLHVFVTSETTKKCKLPKKMLICTVFLKENLQTKKLIF